MRQRGIPRRAVRRRRRGRGVIGRVLNRAIDALPIELHVPGYQYCGPGTRLTKRLSRGDPGINPLDQACKKHDIAYHEFKGGEERKRADEELAKSAWSRVVSRDAGLKERAAALGVVGAMKLKSKLGGGVKEDIRVLDATVSTQADIHRKLKAAATAPRRPGAQPPLRARPFSASEKLAMEVERARANVRRKQDALRRDESDRDLFLKTYLTEPVQSALHGRKEAFDRGPDRGSDAAPPTCTEEEEEDDDDTVVRSDAAPPTRTEEDDDATEEEEEDDDGTEEDDDGTVVPDASPRTSDSAFTESGIPYGYGDDPVWRSKLNDAYNGTSDITYGPRFDDDGRLYMGHALMHIHNDGAFSFNDNDDFYAPTPGLLALLFDKSPDPSLPTPEDTHDYKEILKYTRAYTVDYAPNDRINVSGLPWKYKKFISPLISPRRGARRRRPRTGHGLRFATTPDYKYWRDPNELVHRLRLLVASKGAGNGTHDGEIIEIENELRDAGIID